MAKKIHNIKPVTVNKENMRLELNTDRLNRNLNNAQFALDSAIMASMQPFMSMETGQFIQTTAAMSAALAGSGQVVAAAAPMGRYLYEGKVMVGRDTRSAWAKKGEKKVVIERNLTYSRGRQSHWFEAAEKKDGDKWMRVIDDEMNKS